jgi:predicted HD phosphohydrolase
VASAHARPAGEIFQIELSTACERILASTKFSGCLKAAAAKPILDPIRLRVAAKRYFCFAQPAYLAALSPAWQQSLAFQGRPMSAAELEGFLALAHARQTIPLRRVDDTAKIRNLKVPTLAGYRELIQNLWH